MDPTGMAEPNTDLGLSMALFPSFPLDIADTQHLGPLSRACKTLNGFKSLEDDFVSKLKNLIANCITSELVLEP